MNPKLIGGLIGAGIGALAGGGLAWLVIEMFFTADEEEEIVYLEKTDDKAVAPGGYRSRFTKVSYEDTKPEIAEVIDYTRYSKLARPYGSASHDPKMSLGEEPAVPTGLLGKKAHDLLEAGFPEDTVKAVFGTSFTDGVIEIDKENSLEETTDVVDAENVEVIHKNIFEDEGTTIIDDDVPDDHVINLISMDTYLNGNETHEKYSCSYFFEDKILAGCDNELDEMDPRWTVGNEAIELLEYENLNNVCVSNLTLKADYEICLSSGSYADALEELKWADTQ